MLLKSAKFTTKGKSELSNKNFIISNFWYGISSLPFIKTSKSDVFSKFPFTREP